MSEADEDSPYCPVCTACGESRCCPKSMCRGGVDCLYPHYKDLPDDYDEFEKDLNYLLEKNDKLYRRLQKGAI